VQNPNRLYARPSVTLVSEMVKFESVIRLDKNGTLINAKSLNAIASLRIQLGD
jgi:phosphotransferase system HPr (HPr) family protein